jgi:hypothetical protein
MINTEIMAKRLTPDQFADKIIAEMTEAGLSFDDMLKVIRLARKKYKQLNIKS